MRTPISFPDKQTSWLFGRNRPAVPPHHDGSASALDAAGTIPRLRSEAIARFDALLREINPTAGPVDPERIHRLMAWLVALTPTRAHHLLDRRLRRAELLRAMLEDFDWDTGPGTRSRLAKLIDYIDRPDDLIPDHQPMLGLLDDVMLIELAWPAFATDAEDYRDFCAYRAEGPAEGGNEAQRDWVRARIAEIAMWREHWHASDSHFGDNDQSGPRFRVS